MLLDHNKFVVKPQAGTFTSKKSFEISDPDTGALLAQAKDITSVFPSLLGAVVIEVRDVSKTMRRYFPDAISQRCSA